MTSRREIALAAVFGLLGVALVQLGIERSWGTAHADPLVGGLRAEAVAGFRVTSSLAVARFLGLAGLVAVAATRSWGRVVVGSLVAITSAGLCVEAVRWTAAGRLRDAVATQLYQCSAGCVLSEDQLAAVAIHRTGPVLAAIGCGLLLLAGLLTVVRGRRWSRLGSSYEAPGGAPEAPVTEKAVWDALDRGDDPTA